jgi:hypothetical protein
VPGSVAPWPGQPAYAEEGSVLGDLAVLTPPLVVCAALLIAIWAFLRHEMGTRRRGRDGPSSSDISTNDQISDPGISARAVSPDADAANDEQAETGQDGCQPGQ